MDRTKYRALAKLALAVAGGPVIGPDEDKPLTPPESLAQRRQRRRKHRERTYGLTHDQFEAMLAAQNGGCAICKVCPEDAEKYLVVDHNHATGAVRALLCSACNTAIGLLADDPARCTSAAAYLVKHSAISTAA